MSTRSSAPSITIPARVAVQTQVGTASRSTSLVAHPFQLDPSSLMGWRRIVMSEMDQPALVVPHVLAVDPDVVTHQNRCALPDGHVVFHEHRLRRTGEANDETLMNTGRPTFVRENARHHAFCGDLDGRPLFGVIALNGRVVGCRMCARRAQEHKEHDPDAAHSLTVRETTP